jgi:hypothetical protein
MSELIAAAVGALLGYILGWLKDERSATRERKAIATALLVELRDVEMFVKRAALARTLPADADYTLPLLHVDTPMIQQFYRNAYRFGPESVAALSDFYRSVVELQSLVTPLGKRPRPGDVARVNLRSICNTWEVKHTEELIVEALASLKREEGTESPYRLTLPVEQENNPISL